MRNLEDFILTPSKNITVFSGENAQGKTNILEAIHICCAARSHRTNKDNEIIKNGSEHAYIDAKCLKRDGIHRIQIGLSITNKKALTINGFPAKRLGELMGHMNCVMFSPEDLSLVKDGPQYRRKFVDIALSQINPQYFYTLQNYQKVLTQRNNLIKSIALNKSSRDTIFIWNEQLVDYGSSLYMYRKEFVEKLNRRCIDIHHFLSGGKEKLELLYISSIKADNKEEAKKKLLKMYERTTESDIKRQTTSMGPHRDDIRLMTEDIEVRSQGSQGQKRTAALSIKLSEIDIMKEYTGESPILLLDDVFSELDNNRRKYLLEYIKDVQTFITCVDIDEDILKDMSDIKIITVKKGRLLV